MNPKLVILGGSTPFTACLVDALKAVCNRLPAYEMILHGRSEANLDLVAQYAHQQLQDWGWRVDKTLSMEEALSGATIVIHQIRYGDMEGRAADEEFCARYEVTADETLGPAALLSGVRLFSDLQCTSLMLKRFCSKAWVLNLTNPLSSVTALMAEAGVEQCIGLCELPWVTVQEAAQILELPSAEVEWHYSGLNHRGFIHELRYQGIDLLKSLSRRLGERTISGITAAQIAQLNAIPLKYFQLVNQSAATPVRRGAYLMNLREQILAELRASSTISPPSLKHRYLEWYPQSVAPMIVALNSAEPITQIVNMADNDGIVWERKAEVCKHHVQVIEQPACDRQVERWLDIFLTHERAFLKTIKTPTPEHILETLAADPTVPDLRVEPLAHALWQECQTQSTMT